MARHMGKLTKRVVDAWSYQKSDPLLWDGELKGFILKANPSGSKVYQLNYRNKFGKERRYTIGRHGNLTVDQAREKANRLLARITLENFDPLEDKQANLKAISVGDVLDAYLNSAKFSEKADSTQYVDRGRIKRHLRPLLGNTMVNNIGPEDVRKAFASIRDGKTSVSIKTKSRGRAEVKGGEGAARMAIRVLRAIFNWAVEEGLMTNNPARLVKIGNDGKRDTVLGSADQYADLFRALDYLEKIREIPSSAADAIRVLALTGARRNEIAAMRWRHVDLKQGLITIPPNNHKAGRKTGKAREIALSSHAQAIISRNLKGGPDDYVFPPLRGEGPIQLSSRLWSKIRKQAGLPEGFSNHSLRHSLGTLLAMQGAEAAEIMAALGHTQLSTTQRYIHFAKDARAALLERHTAGIGAALTGKSETADVIEIKEKS